MKYFIPPIVQSILGMEETQILKVVNAGYNDVQSIHFLTGIPLECIESKIRALAGLGLVRTLDNGKLICTDDSGFLLGLNLL